jgi:hypothetical protein
VKGTDRHDAFCFVKDTILTEDTCGYCNREMGSVVWKKLFQNNCQPGFAFSEATYLSLYQSKTRMKQNLVINAWWWHISTRSVNGTIV